MSEHSEFFLASAPDVVQLDCIEISHPDFSQTYRIVRNAPSGVTVTQDAEPVTDWLFDGVDDRIDFPDTLDMDKTDSRTWSTWVRTPSVASQQVIIGKLQAGSEFTGWEFGLEAPGRAYLFLCADFNGGVSVDGINVQTANGSVPTTNILTHVVATYDGSNHGSGIKFYVNKVLVGTAPLPKLGPIVGSISSTATLTMGVRATGLDIPFEGTAAHTSIFDAELSADQVEEIFDAGPGADLNALPTAPAPVFWVKLDETDSTGTDGVIDHGSGGNDGTANFDPTITGTDEVDYEYYPLRVMPIASTDDLVQALSVTLGDVGDVIAAEIETVWEANGMDTRPTLTYRQFRSDDLSAPIYGPIELEIANVTTSREGASFEARAPETNASRTGELYTVERFPMLAGFQ